MSYPSTSDAMPEGWVDSANALQKALHELGVSAKAEARNNGTPGSDLIIVSISGFDIRVDYKRGHWIGTLPSIRGRNLDEIHVPSAENLPPRALAITVVGWAIITFAVFVDTVDLSAEDARVGTAFQALLFELTRAQVSATVPGHWLGIDSSASEEEDDFLTAYAEATKEAVKAFLQHIGVPSPIR